MIAERITRTSNLKVWNLSQRLDPLVKYISTTNDKNKCYYVEKNLVRKNVFNIKSSASHNNSKCIYTSLRTHFGLETDHALNILNNSVNYSESTVTPLADIANLEDENAEHLLQKNWITMTDDEIVKNFQTVSLFIYKYDENTDVLIYRGILEAISSRFTMLTDSHLFHLIDSLKYWNKNNHLLVNKQFWKLLDNECLIRMSHWTINEILMVNHCFCKLKFFNSSFTSNSLKNIDPKMMSPANLVQYALLLKIFRPSIKLYELEHYFNKIANNLTVDELGIIAMTYFRYQVSINNKNFLLLIIQKVLENINDVSDITLVAILKILRFSIYLDITKQLNMLLTALAFQVPTRSLQTITHIAHLQARILLYNSGLTTRILNRFEKEISNARIKDIERIVFTLYTFNYSPVVTPFYAQAMKEFLSPVRSLEIQRFPKSFLYTVLYMLNINYYPEEALKIVMAPEFINQISENKIDNLDRTYLVMDYCIELDHPKYNGPRIKKYILHYLSKKFGSLSKDFLENKQDSKLMMDIAHHCKQILGPDSVYIDALLPHFDRSQMIICYDQNTNSFISPKEKLSNYHMGSIKYAPKDDKKWYAIIVGQHNIITRNTYQASGSLAVQLRHLKCIGYTPIMIPFYVWKTFSHNSMKQQYISNLFLKQDMNLTDNINIVDL